MRAIVKEVSWESRELPAPPMSEEQIALTRHMIAAGSSPEEIKNVVKPPKSRLWVHLRIRAIPLDKLSGKRAVIEHVPRIGPVMAPIRDQSGQLTGEWHEIQVHLQEQVGDHVRGVFDEFHRQDLDGNGVWETDGEERIFEYEFEFDDETHGASLLDPCGTFDLESEVDLDLIASHAQSKIERALCLMRNGHSRCHRLAGHRPDFHHHLGGKVWAVESKPRLVLPEVTS